jgi:hypothetical protein
VVKQADDDQFVVIDGYKRVRALRRLPFDKASYVLVSVIGIHGVNTL